MPNESPETMKLALEYMYSGNIRSMQSNSYNSNRNIDHERFLAAVRQLLPVARRYEIIGLTQFLYEKLFAHITTQNAVQTALVLEVEHDQSEFAKYRNQIMNWIMHRLQTIAAQSDIDPLLTNRFTRGYLCTTVLGKRRLDAPTLVTAPPLKLRCQRPH